MKLRVSTWTTNAVRGKGGEVAEEPAANAWAIFSSSLFTTSSSEPFEQIWVFKGKKNNACLEGNYNVNK